MRPDSPENLIPNTRYRYQLENGEYGKGIFKELATENGLVIVMEQFGAFRRLPWGKVKSIEEIGVVA